MYSNIKVEPKIYNCHQWPSLRPLKYSSLHDGYIAYSCNIVATYIAMKHGFSGAYHITIAIVSDK